MGEIIEPFKVRGVKIRTLKILLIFLSLQVFAHLLILSFLGLFNSDDVLITPRANAKAVLSAIFNQTIGSPRDLMVFGGAIVCVIFFNMLPFYLKEYIDDIWNEYYVKKSDVKKLYYFHVYYFFQYVFIAIYPNLWWVGVVITFFTIERFLKIRLENTIAILDSQYRLRKEGAFYKVESATDASQLHDEYTTKLYALIAIRRNFATKGLVYGGIMIAIVASCQILRKAASPETSYILSGAYFSASLIFVLFSIFSVIVRSNSTLPAMKKRIAYEDFEYFRSIAR